MSVCATLAASALAFATASAWAGPDWDLDLQEDAGNNLAGAQPITIPGQVQKIRGVLAGFAFNGGEGDFQDVYLFQITTPVLFQIDLTGEGAVGFDSCLWLFSYEGKPLLGNNDAAPGEVGSLLGPESNDGPFVTLIDKPGLYYLAISGFASQPLGFNGEFLFPQSVFTPGNITGGLDGRFNGTWSDQGAVGNYDITVTGVGGVPGPGAIALLGVAGLAGRRRRGAR